MRKWWYCRKSSSKNMSPGLHCSHFWKLQFCFMCPGIRLKVRLKRWFHCRGCCWPSGTMSCSILAVLNVYLEVGGNKGILWQHEYLGCFQRHWLTAVGIFLWHTLSCVPCKTQLWPRPATFSIAWIWQDFHGSDILLWCAMWCIARQKANFQMLSKFQKVDLASLLSQCETLVVFSVLKGSINNRCCLPFLLQACVKCALLLSYSLCTRNKRLTDFLCHMSCYILEFLCYSM